MSAQTPLYENIYNKGTAFSFGKNWSEFLKTLTPERIEHAKGSLIQFLGYESLAGKTFVDIGCGSGLFSLAAYLLGAERVVSVDIDENSVGCARFLREQQGNPVNWEIRTGSALDRDFIASLGTFDVVYSWGVLHHTGDMYRAFDNVVQLLDSGSIFYIAIYNRYVTSRAWYHIKKMYFHTPNSLKSLWLVPYYIYATLILAVQKKWILSEIRNYSISASGRGMSYHIDVLDWLGGYPYEYASTRELVEYFARHGLTPLKTKDGNGPACNEILFQKP